MTRALITGITGQDGAYLARFLLEKGYEVYGTYRRLSTPNFWRLQSLDIYDHIRFIPADLIDSSSLTEALVISKPDELYHLAAQSFVGASFEQPIGAGEVTGLGTARLLEAIRHIDTGIKFYQASTSELYGNVVTEVHDEDVPFHPASPYSAAKLYAYWMTRIYREAYGIFACNGILFNHESPLRGLEFVTRKITNAVARISLGLEDKLSLGNLSASRDWGYAPEYVESMWLMFQRDKPGDYVIATGVTHSVERFAEAAFSVLGLDYSDYVVVDVQHQRPLDVKYLKGSYSKAERELGWKPRITFDGLVEIMVKEDLARWTSWKNGSSFRYWDALSYPSDGNIATRAVRM